MHFLSRVTRRVVAALVVAAMFCTCLTSLGFKNVASAVVPSNDAVTELGGDLTWGEFLSALYQGGKFKLTADFSDEISKDESDRDMKAALNIVHYTEEAGMYPYYDNIGPVLIEEDTEIDLNGHSISRVFPKAGEYHSAGMVIWVRNGAKLTITDSQGGGTISGGSNKGTSGMNTWTVDGVTINTRLCKTNGGGIYIENGELYLLGGTICNNTCSYMEKDYAGGCGGGLYVAEGSVVIGEDATISNNTAFSKGSAVGLGGGLYAAEGTSIVIDDEASVSGNAPSSAEHPEINIPAGVVEFTVHFVLESDETVKVLDDVVGEASVGSVIKSDDYPEHASTLNGHLVGRTEHTSMTVLDSEENELFIKYAYLTPTATVSDITAPQGVRVFDLDTREESKYIVDIGQAAKFVADDVTSVQYNHYKNWNCDYAISVDSAVDAESFGLWGKYDNGQTEYDLAFVYPNAIASGDKVLLLSNLLGEEGLCTYDFVKNTVGAFECGAFNLDEANNGKTMTVELLLWPADGTVEDAVVIKSFTYGFGDLATLREFPPALPTATITELEALQDVTLTDINTRELTDYFVDIAHAVRFDADSVTDDQFGYYMSWNCDFAVTFDDDIDAESFGLWGKYDNGQVIYDVAFVYPNAIASGDKVLLLSGLLGEEGLCTYDFVKNTVGSFSCGAFNLDDNNTGKTMKVQLIMWPLGYSSDEATVIAEFDYNFDDLTELTSIAPELPGAELTDVSAPTDVDLYDTDGNLLKKTVDIGEAKKFTALDVTDEQMNYYGDWHCDFAVSFDSDIEAESFGLYGQYGEFERAFLFPSVSEGDRVLLLTTLLNDGDLCTYDFIKNTVSSFTCGAFNLDEANDGKTMTVQLIMWADGASVDDAEVIAEFEYKFGDLTEIVPELPTATIFGIDPLEDVALIDANTREITKNHVDISYAISFLADDVSEDRFNYYKNWNCDFAVTFDSDIDAETFGLWGRYDTGTVIYDAAFLYPNAITAGERVLLLTELLGEEGLCTYDYVKNVVGSFDCGAFNLDMFNRGKKMKIQLIMWPEDGSVDDAAVITEFDYAFENLTKIVPELPTASFESVTAPSDVEVYDFSYELTGQLTDIEYAGKFTADDVTDDQFEYYRDWLCDFAVSFDAPMEGGSFGLYGAYGELERTFVFPNNLDAEEEVYLLFALGDSDICNYFAIKEIVKEFTCGVFNLSEDNIGKTMKVDLIMYPSADRISEAVVIRSFTYSIGSVTELRDIIPEPPTATVSDSVSANRVKVADSLSVVGEIGDVYRFIADEPTDDQYEYYKNWRCDYIISFSKDVSKQSIGLYGRYGEYELAIIPNVDFAADTDFFMMEQGLGNPCDYKEILNDVSDFSCAAFNLNAVNEGTVMTVRLVIWDADEENPEYIDLCEPVVYTLGSPIELLGPYTVELSSKDDKGNTGIATLVGGGDDYVFDSSVTISASDVRNYRFVGWFNGEDLVSPEQEYTFNIKSDISYVAVYECLISTATLHVVGEHYTVNDSVEQVANGDFEVSVGETATVKYVGDDFLYWTNESDNIVSTSAEYSFVFVCETKIKLVTSTNAQNSVRIVVLNSYSQVLQTGNFDDAIDIADFLEGIAPTKMGATFSKWVFKGTKTEATPEAILALAETDTPFCEIVPTYTATQDAGEFTLTVNVLNGTELLTDDTFSSVTYAAGKNVRINIADLFEAFGLTDTDEFNYWSLDGGETVVSNEDSYLIVSVGGAEIVLTAVFNSEEEFDVDANITITQMFATESNGNYILSTSLSYFIPDGCSIRELGFVYSVDPMYSGNLEALVLGAPSTHKSISSLTLSSGVFTFNANARNDGNKVLYIRAYMIYTDGEGNVVTMYSDNAKYGSYYSLNGLN